MTSDRAAAEKEDATPSAPSQRARNLLRDQLVGQKLGRYDILHRIASGGMGSVYVGRARGVADFERLVAIKVLHPHLAHQEDFVAMFLDEARLAAQIRHPNVVATLDVCPTAAGYFLVMEYVEGDHLGGLARAAARAGERLPVPIVLRILVDGLAGLAAAHDLRDRTGGPLNLVHRDVSPQNVLIGKDGLARLTDFGVAKAEHRISSTREGQFKGKLAYTSPEQAATGEVEQRSDLFAMGVVLWEVLTGKRLFGAETNQATLRRLLDDPIPALSSVEPRLAPLDGVLAKALSRSLDERFQTAHEMQEAIEAVAPKVGGLASTRSVAQAVRRLAHEKLERERTAVETAIAEAGPAEPASEPTGAQAIHIEVDTVRPPALGSRKPPAVRAAWIVAGVLVLAALGAVVWMATGEDEPSTADEPASVSEEQPPVEAAATAPDPAEQEAAGEHAPAEQEQETDEQQTDEQQTDEQAREETRAERLERLRRLRALRRAREQEQPPPTMMESPSAMDPADILDNPYRNR